MPPDSLEAVQFFANSANRIQVLEALADGVTKSNRLAERADVSRSTVARILGEAESRGWVDSAGSRYELTPLGEVMAEEFRTHLETVAAAQELGPVINYLPDPARELDLRHLRDATITTPSEDWPQAHFNRGLELYQAGDTCRSLTKVAPDMMVRTLATLVDSDDLDFEGVIEAPFIETLEANPDRAEPWYSIAEGMWVYPGRVPINMHIIDGRVMLWLVQLYGDEKRGAGLLESTNPTVVAWAESLYEEYLSAAEPLDPAQLPDS